MTDNEIIKALECCGINQNCKGCYFDTHESGDICAREVVKNAFDLINRQQAEIERLKIDKALLRQDVNADSAEIRALRRKLDDRCWDFCSISGCEGASNDCWKTCPDSRYNKIKNEAVKEFAERLKELYTSEFISDDFHFAVGAIKQNIDDIMREMVGDK